MKYFHILLLTLLSLSLPYKSHSQTYGNVSMLTGTQPLHEVRAVWLTTIGGLDWPHSYAQGSASIEKQKSEFRTTLDRLNAAGINTILLQTRIRATTIFPSDMEPWDGCLSGVSGKSPGYDALQFAIDECHQRGMQIHAWVVSIPVGKWNGAGCRQLRKTVPNLLKKVGDEGFLNPELPGTGDYIARFCTDIVRRYDVDGIHLDYIRYPDGWGKICPEGKQKRPNIARGRAYITDIVRKVSNAVKKEKKWVMLSCSPVGKYADLPRQSSRGWNARDAVAQDAVLWLKEGLMDALFPMMYFKDQNFYPFAIDWQERSCGRIVVPGLGIYFMSPKEKNWPLVDITREMHFLRQSGAGFCFFRSKFFTDNTKGIYDFTRQQFCRYPALIPPMKWYGFRSPEAPDSVSYSFLADGTGTLTWSPATDNSDGNYLRYNIYASSRYPVDVTDAKNLIAVYRTTTSLPILRGCNYAVTAVDRYGNESQPLQCRTFKPRDVYKIFGK